MEKSEPSLVPEWLRTGGGSSTHHFASSQDGPILALPKRHGSSKSSNYDAPRSSFLDRSLSSNARRSSSSNGSIKSDKNLYSRSYSSFSRSHRDREKDRLSIAENWDAEYSDPLKSITGRIGKDTLKRSQSMVQRKQSEVSQRRLATDLRNSSNNHLENGNDSLSVSTNVTGINKVSFERDFPSLGSEDSPTTPDISRVPSPGLTKGVQSLSMGMGGEGWTSALAEVPVGVGSCSFGSSPALQPAPAVSTSSSGAAGTMAEALVQSSPRTQATSQPTLQTNRLEELALRQSKRLIPMTPSMTKASVLNSSDKLKPKTALRSSEPVAVTKSSQPLQQLTSLQIGNQSLRGGNAKAGIPKASNAKLVLSLKQGRENGSSPSLKDVSSPTSHATSKVGNGQIIGVPSAAALPSNNSNNPKLATLDPKKSAQKQSRNDFFNLMRKKSMNSSSVNTDSGPDGEKPNEQKIVTSTSPSPATKNGMEMSCNGEASTGAQKFSDAKHEVADNATIYPDEEEAAFLRSLGWEENAVDEGGLTEEEINAFYDELFKLEPNWAPTTSVCRGLKMKLLTESRRQAACSGGASSQLSAADSSI